MPIDPNQVQWDSEPIDLSTVQWDSEPRPDFANVQTRVSGTNAIRTPRKPAPKRTAAQLTGISDEQMDPAYRNQGTIERVVTSAFPVTRLFTPEGRAGIGKSMVDTARGIRQVANDAGMVGVGLTAGAMNKAGMDGNALVRAAGLPMQDKRRAMQREEADRRQTDAPLMQTPNGMIGNVAGTAGQVLLPGAAFRGSSLAKMFLPQGAGNVAQGALLGAIQPATSDDDRQLNVRIGTGAGAAGIVLPAAIRRWGESARNAADPVKQAAIETAEQAGIPLHASQVSDSYPAKVVASLGKYLPFSGATAAADSQQSAFNRALARTFGADADQLTDDVMRGARNKLSAQFEDVYARNDVPVGPDQIRRLVGIENDAAGRITLDDARIVRNQVDSILNEAADTGLLTGQKYQALRTKIMQAEGPDKVGAAVASIRKELDKIAAETVGPEDAATLRKIRSQWANLRTVEKALKQVSGAGGDVKASAIWPLIRNGSTAEMRDLGRVGQLLLKDPVPDSGTAGRSLWLGLLGGGGVVGGPSALPTIAGLALAGSTAGRLANSNRLAKVLAGAGKRRIAAGQAKALAPAGTVTAVEVRQNRRSRAP